MATGLANPNRPFMSFFFAVAAFLPSSFFAIGFDGATERNTSFDLFCYRTHNNISVEFGSFDFIDIDLDLLADESVVPLVDLSS